jgi:hypothetical protein
MKSLKILSLLFFSIAFSANNLNAMEKAKDLLSKVENFYKEYKQEVSALKYEINPKRPVFVYALTLMLERDVNNGDMQNLQTLIETRKYFEEFLNENQFKQLMYWLIYCSAQSDQTQCIKYIYQEYLDLFKISIFENQEEDNEGLFGALLQEGKLDSISLLISQKILDYISVEAFPELIKLAGEKNFADLVLKLKQKLDLANAQKADNKRAKVAEKKISHFRPGEIYCSLFVIITGLSAAILPRFLS